MGFEMALPMAPVSPPETTLTANGIGCEESCEGKINAYFFWCAHKRQMRFEMVPLTAPASLNVNIQGDSL